MVDPGLFISGTLVVLDTPLSTLPRCQSVIRGHRPGRYLVLDAPLCNNQEVRLEAGIQCLVRMVLSDQVVAFRCHCLGRSPVPEPLLFLSYPDHVDYGQIRKGQSFQVCFETSISQEPGSQALDPEHHNLIVGISEDGCQLQAERALAFGAKVFLSFNLPEVGPVRDLEVTVKTARKTAVGWLVEGLFSPACDAACRQVRAYLQTLADRQLDDAMLRLSTLA